MAVSEEAIFSEGMAEKIDFPFYQDYDSSMEDTITFLYDIYGRMQMEVVCRDESRTAYRIISGRRHLERDFVIPDGYSESQIRTYLDDMFHEMARPGQEIRLMRKT
ncbi:MAG: hypothetical protein PHD48_05765 [Alphaproteobacteria bacterium]|nr:hypothetical protein [Alphaproteobacteria bacterium]